MQPLNTMQETLMQINQAITYMAKQDSTFRCEYNKQLQSMGEAYNHTYKPSISNNQYIDDTYDITNKAYKSQ